MKSLKKTTINQLVADITEARNAYYTDGSSRWSDEEYDAMEQMLRDLDPKNSILKKVGSPAVGVKVKHRVPMLSMQKAKTFEEIQKWIAKTNWGKWGKLWLVEPKVDGNSVSLRYSKGVLQHAVTRGDGKEGQDITHIVKLIEDIPQTITHQEDFEVRGELYLPKGTKTVKGTPLRNVVAGLLNPDRKDVTQAHQIKFVACRLLPTGDHLIPSEQRAVEWLRAQFSNVIPYTKAFEASQIHEIWKEHNDEGKRHLYEYELDGLVIVVDNWAVQELQPNNNDHHLDFNIAYKFSNEYKRTTLCGVTWQMSRHGSLIPVANFEPVNIGGTTIRNAGMANARAVENLKMMIGDEIEITRSNDIIPALTKSFAANLDKRNYSPLILQKCPHCNTELEWKGVHLHCPNRNDCDEQQIQRIVHWVVACEMDGVSEQTVRALWYNASLRSISGLYVLKNQEAELHYQEGFGKSKISNLLAQIERSRKVSIHDFIERLGIPSVGVKSAKKLGINSLQQLLQFQSDGSAIGDAVASYVADANNYQEIVALSECLQIENHTEKQGKLVCATGKAPMARNDLIKLLERNGYVWSDSVTKDLHLLLCDDPHSGSTKNKKAEKLGIQVMTYDLFLNMLGS